MDTLTIEFTNLAFGIIDKIKMPMSIIQVLALFAFIGICAYTGHLKISLVTSFFTVVYWTYASNKVWLFEVTNGSFYGMLAAITIGMAVAFIGFVGILQERR